MNVGTEPLAWPSNCILSNLLINASLLVFDIESCHGAQLAEIVSVVSDLQPFG